MDQASSTKLQAWQQLNDDIGYIMKTIKLDIKGASEKQLLTLRIELEDVSRSWKKVGVTISLDGKMTPASRLRIQASSLNKINTKSINNLQRW